MEQGAPFHNRRKNGKPPCFKQPKLQDLLKRLQSPSNEKFENALPIIPKLAGEAEEQKPADAPAKVRYDVNMSRKRIGLTQPAKQEDIADNPQIELENHIARKIPQGNHEKPAIPAEETQKASILPTTSTRMMSQYGSMQHFDTDDENEAWLRGIKESAKLVPDHEVSRTWILENKYGRINFDYKPNPNPNPLYLPRKRAWPFGQPDSNSNVKPKSKKHAASRKRPGNHKYEQQYLDVGQKRFGGYQCPTCGMIYNQGEINDEKMHTDHHRQVIERDKLLLFDKLNKLPLDKYCATIIDPVSKERVLVFQTVAEKSFVARYMGLIQRAVHDDMGSIDLVGKMQVPDVSVYLYVKQGRIASCLLTERIQHARSLCEDDLGGSASVVDGDTDSDEEENESSKANNRVSASLGFFCIWTHPEFRRHGYALYVLHVARFYHQFSQYAVESHGKNSSTGEGSVVTRYVSETMAAIHDHVRSIASTSHNLGDNPNHRNSYGSPTLPTLPPIPAVVPVDCCAFSAPTWNGFQLAKSFFNRGARAHIYTLQDRAGVL